MAAKILLAAGMDWPFPARLAGAFVRLGARVEAACPKASPLRRSQAPSGLHDFSFSDPLAALARAIEKSAPDLVIPCDDLTAELLWRLGGSRPDLTPLLEKSCGPRDAYPLLASRNDFLAAAKTAGAPIADNIPLKMPADAARAIAALGLPLVVKADGSWGGDGVAIARDAGAVDAAIANFSRGGARLKAVLRAIRRRESHWLVRARFAAAPSLSAQRFVPGHPATSAIACWRGRVVAANHFDVAVANGTGPATVLAVSRDPVMDDAAARIAHRFNLSGLFGLDYMRGSDGRALLLEINPRATPTAHLALGAGHDLAAALLTAVGHPVPDRPAATALDRIALFPQELRRDPQSPHLAGAYHDLPLDDAPLLAALAGAGAALTGFSQAFPGTSDGSGRALASHSLTIS